MSNLFAKKSMQVLLAQAQEEGTDTLERSLGKVRRVVDRRMRADVWRTAAAGLCHLRQARV